MLAIFKTGGKQYSAKAGQILKVEKLSGEKGDKISFTDVLAISDDKTNSIGEPLLKDASIEAKIIDQIRHKSAIKVTIGGCVIEKIENSVVIYKEITK